MGIGKWITGAIGWALGGPLGGLVGYLLGSLFEGDQNQAQRVYSQGGGFSANEQRNSFLVSLLVLSAAVMKSDGKVLR